jgi:putative nucleotidyltransferase with HDIG domain
LVHSQSFTEEPIGAGPRIPFDGVFAEPESFPALEESCARLLRALDRGEEQSSIAASLESDTGLLVAALQSTNRSGRFERSVASAPKAVEVLGPRALRALAESWPTIDPLDGTDRSVMIGMWLRAHALNVGMMAERLGHEIGYPECDELVTSALLHDVGKLALLTATGEANLSNYHRYATEVDRDQLGIDHATLGGVLARRWKLPERVAQAIERHHDTEVAGQAAVVLLADQLTHFSHGNHSDINTIISLSERVGLDRSVLGDLLYELPNPVMAQRRQVRGGIPLSSREIDVLKLLAQGKLYKEIAADLDVSASTVRSHLHRIYHRIGAKDRAQAVLIAVERNWI